MDYFTKIKRWLPSVFWAAVIFVLSSLPGADFSEGPKTDYIIRKVLHIIEYSILCLTFYRGTKDKLISVLLTVLYSVLDEIHQTFIPTRTGRLSDIFIDGTGAIISGIILWKYFQNLPQKLRNWLLE